VAIETLSAFSKEGLASIRCRVTDVSSAGELGSSEVTQTRGAREPVSHIRVPARASRWSGKNNPTFAREPLDDGSSLTNNDFWFADAGDNMVDSGNGNDVIFINSTHEFAPQGERQSCRTTRN